MSVLTTLVSLALVALSIEVAVHGVAMRAVWDRLG